MEAYLAISHIVNIPNHLKAPSEALDLAQVTLLNNVC